MWGSRDGASRPSGSSGLSGFQIHLKLEMYINCVVPSASSYPPQGRKHLSNQNTLDLELLFESWNQIDLLPLRISNSSLSWTYLLQTPLWIYRDETGLGIQCLFDQTWRRLPGGRTETQEISTKKWKPRPFALPSGDRGERWVVAVEVARERRWSFGGRRLPYRRSPGCWIFRNLLNVGCWELPRGVGHPKWQSTPSHSIVEVKPERGVSDTCLFMRLEILNWFRPGVGFLEDAGYELLFSFFF